MLSEGHIFNFVGVFNYVGVVRYGLPSLPPSMNRGKLPYQQDRVKVVPNLHRGQHFYNSPIPYFAVFDGHGGDECAEFCATFLHERLQKELPKPELSIEDGLRKAFVETDLQFQHKYRFHKSGTTATCVLLDLTGGEIYVANVGDSPCIASRFGKATELIQLHKPDVPSERKRVEASATVSVFSPQNNPSRPPRLNGRLAVSRAIGDWAFKPCCPAPYVCKLKMTPDIDFLVLGSDGLFDRLTYQGVLDYVAKNREEIVTHPKSKQSLDMNKYTTKEKASDAGNLIIPGRAEKESPYIHVLDGVHVAEGLCHLALAEQSTDNISAIVIFLDWEEVNLGTYDSF
eukprot:g49820.t1